METLYHAREGIMKVGVIGIGAMGFNMAKALAEAGYEVYAHDIERKKMAEIMKLGIKAAESPGESAQ